MNLTMSSSGDKNTYYVPAVAMLDSLRGDSPVDEDQDNEFSVTVEKLKKHFTTPVGSKRPIFDNYQCASFFATLCCFMPLGIFAFVKLGDAQEAKERGDKESMTKNIREAKKMILFSIVMATVFVTLCMVMALLILVFLGRKLTEPYSGGPPVTVASIVANRTK